MVKSTWSKNCRVKLLRNISCSNDNNTILKSNLSLLITKTIDLSQKLSQDPIRYIRVSSLLSNCINFIKEDYARTDLLGMSEKLSNFLLRVSHIFVKYLRTFDWYEVHSGLVSYGSGKHCFGATRRSIKQDSFRWRQSSIYKDLRVFQRKLNGHFYQIFGILVATNIFKRKWL